MLYINSPGGVITAGLAIYDTMNLIKSDVATICLGDAASMGAFLLCSGAKGKRMALPNSRIMIHQPLGGAKGQATDIEIEAKEINQIESENSYIKFTNQLLGLPKKIFAIDENQKKKVITEFKELMIQGNLPEPIQIEIKTKKENKIKQETIEDKLSDLFGDEIVIMED